MINTKEEQRDLIDKYNRSKNKNKKKELYNQLMEYEANFYKNEKQIN